MLVVLEVICDSPKVEDAEESVDVCEFSVEPAAAAAAAVVDVAAADV